MLVGRAGERRRLDRLLEAAPAGRSGALLIRGEPGIGKSALLRYAVERAKGMTVLATRGVESESELPFAGLAHLLAPVLRWLRSIPAPQAEALAGALALSAPAVAAEPFPIFAGTLSLMAAAAEHAALLAVVDDAHWLDASSVDALLFASRRLHAEGVVMLFAVREREGTAFDDAGLDELELTGLGPGPARALLRRAAPEISPSVADQLITATRGNPLALIELPGLLSGAQLAGTSPIDEPVPAGPSIERGFARRLAGLSEEARQALLVAAASESSALAPVLAAMKTSGLDRSALEQAESAGLVTIRGGELEFSHPLLRSVAYHGATGIERRAAHRSLAAALAGERPAERRAWHLAAATLSPDEEIASMLEQAAHEARRRSGHAGAAAAFDRAARLTPEPEARARRLLEAGRELLAAGGLERAIETLNTALAATDDPLLRADIQHQRALGEMWGGDPGPARGLLVAEAERVERLDPSRAATMLIDASIGCSMAGDCRATLVNARLASAVAERAGTAVQQLAGGLVANGLVLCGEAPSAYPLLVRCRALFEEAYQPELSPALTQAVGHGSIWVEDYAEAGRILDRVIAEARAKSAGGLLPFPLACRSELDFRTGRWASAYAHGSESLRLAEETSQPNVMSFALVCLAQIEAAQGRVELCRGHVATARRLADSLGVGSILTYSGAALGLLELGLGRLEQAIAELDQVALLVEEQGLGEPAVVQWAPELIEACIRAGRLEPAERAVSAFEAQARATERTWAKAAAARCRGLLAPDGEFEEHFAAAIAQHELTTTPFERARTELCLGERLRRARRRRAARGPLRSALVTFTGLGAAPWEERARRELGVGNSGTGEAGKRTERLTPQELQVALLVAKGATNRDAAEALFLSPKTIDFHLGNVYRKLGVHSRAALAGLLAREGTQN